MNSPAHVPPAPQPGEVPRRSRWPKVVGLIGAGVVLLVLAAILIPCFVDSRSAANESSAVGSLRIIANAQGHFVELHPERGFASSLSELGASADDQIDAILASGTKNGYVFKITSGVPDSAGRITKYAVIAVPQIFNKTGMRGFFVDESGVIRYAAKNRPATVSDPPLS